MTEQSSYKPPKIWKWDEEKLIELAKEEIYQTKLVPINSVIDGKVIRVPKCYPVYSVGYKKNLIPIKDYLSKFRNISVIGRYGSFKYNNQDHSILMGLLSAENIIKDKKNNLWEINTDYEYQEDAIINKK